MEDWMIRALEKAKERISKMSKEEIYEELYGERDRKRAHALKVAPAVSNLIIDNDIHFDDEEFRYFPGRYQVLLNHFSKYDIETFAGWLDTSDSDIVSYKSSQDELDFPNEQYHTKFGVTIDIIWGQGARIRVYKTVVPPPFSDEEKFIKSEN